MSQKDILIQMRQLLKAGFTQAELRRFCRETSAFKPVYADLPDNGSLNDIIDINAGTVISGEDSIESMGEKILEHIIKVASGEVASKAVLHGNNDFIPWKRGVSL